MPVNPAIEGKTYPPTEPYLVGREKVREFARAVFASNPVNLDPQAARDAGHRDIVAPPTFPVVVQEATLTQLLDDPEAGIDFSRVVHGEEKFVHHAPLVAGDEIATTVHVDRVREVAGNAMVTTRSELATLAGQARATVTSSLVVRGEDS